MDQHAPASSQPSSTPSSSSSKTSLTIGIILTVVVVGIIAELAWHGTPSATQGSTASTGSYKDGSYDAMGTYRTPGGQEQIDVKVTLQNNLITDATVTPETTHPISLRMQNTFAANFKPLVIGKNINDVQLSAVSGSSLTPMGFNDALNQIKQQAKM